MDEVVTRGASAGNYVAIAALVIWTLISLLKSSAVPIEIPPRVRPWVAFGLGQAYAALVVVLNGSAPGDAIVAGVLATVLAIGGQELGSSASPKPTNPNLPPLALLLAFALLGGGSLGCSTAQLEAGINAGNVLLVEAKPCLVATHEAKLEECGADEACRDKVKAKGAILADAALAIRATWCALAEDAEAKGCP